MSLRMPSKTGAANAPLIVALVAAGSLASWLLLGACAETDCDKANQKADQCGYDRIPDPSMSASSSSGATFGQPVPQQVHECGTLAQCQASCVNLTSCDALLANGKDKPGETTYFDCLNACR